MSGRIPADQFGRELPGGRRRGNPQASPCPGRQKQVMKPAGTVDHRQVVVGHGPQTGPLLGHGLSQGRLQVFARSCFQASEAVGGKLAVSEPENSMVPPRR